MLKGYDHSGEIHSHKRCTFLKLEFYSVEGVYSTFFWKSLQVNPACGIHNVAQRSMSLDTACSAMGEMSAVMLDMLSLRSIR
jgi:hypothetical protein